MADALSEHIQYLTLPGRSDLYRAAITSEMAEGAHVVDLGCGVGVLGFFCLEAGAAKVWGIDHSDAIHLASEAADRAGFGESYECIADTSFRVTLPQAADLIICDHVGFFGFDYGIIAMLADARARMLAPGGVIMPKAIDLMVAAVSSEKCSALAGRWTNEAVPEHFHWLEEYQRNSRHAYDFTLSELISPASTIGHVAFDADTPENFSFETVLEIAEDGEFHGLAGWFDCHLGGVVRMTNSPLSDASIKRSQAFLPVKQAFSVKQGDTIPVTLRFADDGTMITWSVTPPGGARKQTLSTWRSTILRPENRLEQSGEPLTLSRRGEARAFALGQVNGERSSADIEELVIGQFPDLFPTRSAIHEFVRKALASDC